MDLRNARRPRQILLLALTVGGLVVATGCSADSGTPTAPVVVKTTADAGLPTLPVGDPTSSSGPKVGHPGKGGSPSSSGGSTGDSRGTTGGVAPGNATSTSTNPLNTLIAKMTIWYATVSPLYGRLQSDYDRLESAVNAADDQGVRDACQALKADAADLESKPPAPDPRTESGLTQASHYTTKAAGECLAGTYDVCLQDFENAKEWAVAVKDRVQEIENSG